MTDDLDRLRAGLRATPAPDPEARARALALAMENFDRAQDAGAAARPTEDRPMGAGLWTGVRNMLNTLTSRGALAATASIAALAVGLALIGPPDMAPTLAPKSAPQPTAPTEAAPAAEPLVEAAEADQPLLRSAPPVATFAPAPMADTAMGYAEAPATLAPATTDRFANADPNPLKVTAEAPVSTFSVDVDTASWAWVRGSIRAGALPDPSAVRIEEMVNYFPYDYPAPAEGEAPFRAAVTTFATPWNTETRLVRIGLQGRLPALDARPPLNLVFLIDTSGSMQGEDRLGLLKSAFGMLLDSLRPEDRVAIVAYSGSAGQVLAPTPASDRAAILAALGALKAGGSTAGGEGLEAAYALAERMAGDGTVNRVVLATDGDFNVGPQDPEALKTYVEAKRDTGIYLSVLGFGRGNLNDALMQALAQNGNGQAAYIDSAEEARKVLVDQAAGALFPIAQDVKIQVEWNPATVAEYRLIGYETRGLAREDFADDRVDAGDIGAGHQVTALYEITPVGSPARRTDPLRYGTAPAGGDTGEFGWLRLRYKAPGASDSALLETPIAAEVTVPDADARFAAAIAGFGQLLTGGRYLGDWGYDAAIALAEGARADDPFGYRTEAVGVMRTAAALAR